MELKRLKLAGFKSFVDPTTVPMPSHLIGVVGPNGCGKSNIIDAIRWCMGESSAKQLRGESIADVIFNGSETRKQAGQASVELVFDNSDNTIKGEFAKYNEISVKRLVTRDGQSNYYLNNTKCRRKDITDLFLGTGLGPRSYSIIEQGTISRIIEAKPEDLRVFLEEAAGISKYKERRRETELRIKHTRENLERVNDIREELGKQLERLKRQARTAERYKELRQEERQLKAQCDALEWQQYHNQLADKDTAIKKLEIDVERLQAECTEHNANIELRSEQHLEAEEHWQQAQTEFYALATEIARLEESIQHQKARKQQLQTDKESLAQELHTAKALFSQDDTQLTELTQSIAQLEPELAQLNIQVEENQSRLEELEQQRSNWQREWDSFQQTASEASKQAQVKQTEIQHIEQDIARQQQRVADINERQASFDFEALQTELAELQAQHEAAQNQAEAEQQTISELQTQIAAKREYNQDKQNQLDDIRAQSQSLQGRISSLEALQQAALGEDNTAFNDWLADKGLHDKPRLVNKLKVAAGWELAVETVLGQDVQAVCVADVAAAAQSLLAAENPSALHIISEQTATSNQQSTITNNESLLGKIEQAPQAVHALLRDVIVATDLATALQQLANLPANASIITQDGIWLSQHWLRLPAQQDDEQQGVIQRQRALEDAQAQLTTLREQASDCETQLESGRESLIDLEQQLDELRVRLRDAEQQAAQYSGQQRVCEHRLQQAKDEHARLAEEKQQCETSLVSAREQLHVNRQAWQQALDAVSQGDEQRSTLAAQREQLDQQYQGARERLQQYREQQHQTDLRLQSARTQQQSLQANRERLQHQIAQLEGRQSALLAQLDEHNAPEHDLDEQLQDKLAQHNAKQMAMQQAKQTVDELKDQLQQYESLQDEAKQQIQQLQTRIQQAQLDAQGLRVRCATIEEHFAEQQEFKLAVVVENLPEDAALQQWRSQLQAIQDKISRLGAINLAAIDEYKLEAERKEYLDAQNDDLEKALTTLENAIKCIDKETKDRFRETFERVNTTFKDIFPKLFGGGQAYLHLSDDDLLTTGVLVMARPPGKRNSSIHLLSGGEKALTAVALVFAIFQLNPSPFCLLDEVDAPLDDANVGRFCRIVKAMSDKTQFILITHNKVTMELAEHLMGVTMQEPGVSRLVSVNVAEAAAMVEA